MQAAIDTLQGRGANHWKKYDGLIDDVTIGALVGFAKAHFQKSKRTQLVVRP
jgi:hypothetical protein